MNEFSINYIRKNHLDENQFVVYAQLDVHVDIFSELEEEFASYVDDDGDEISLQIRYHRKFGFFCIFEDRKLSLTPYSENTGGYKTKEIFNEFANKHLVEIERWIKKNRLRLLFEEDPHS